MEEFTIFIALSKNTKNIQTMLKILSFKQMPKYRKVEINRGPTL